MEFNLENLFRVSHTLCIIDLLIVASHKVSTQHGFGLANHLKDLLVQRCLDDAVIELDNQHVIVVTSQRLGNKLRVLNLIIIEASIELILIEICFILGLPVDATAE